MNKKKYMAPTVEVVSMQTVCTILAGSQTDWADAKSNVVTDSFWDDEINDDYQEDDNTNWAGYQKNINLW